MKTGGRRSGNIVDRRGQVTTRGAAGGAAAGLLLRFLFSRMGRRFLLPLLVVGAVAWFVFPQQTRSILSGLLGGGGGVQQRQLTAEERAELEAQQRVYEEFISTMLATTEEVWGDLFAAAGETYAEPQLVYYTQGTPTGCGFGSAAAGPFYCPAPDPETGRPAVYLDLSFFPLMAAQMNAGGDFAQAYVVAHEVGHHVQNLQGVLDWSMQAKRGASEAEQNQIQVRVELMADCYAGVWAKRAQSLPGVTLDAGDIEEALRAAHAVGDDTLQKAARGRVETESFTHGSAEQRIRWFRAGYSSGAPATCDTRTPAYGDL